MKRGRSDDLGLLEDWKPLAGIPCHPFGPAEERAKKELLYKTSMIYLELEVRSESSFCTCYRKITLVLNSNIIPSHRKLSEINLVSYVKKMR